MKYQLSIEGSGGTINIDKDSGVIKKIDIKISQSDKSANDRSDQLFADLVIHGLLTDKSQEQTKDMFNWSMKTDKASVYTVVSIKVFNQEELLRDYYLKDMYCTSYQESFDEYVSESDGRSSDSIGSFVLEMKQRKGSIETIKVECN